MMSRGLPRDKREGKSSRQRRKLSAVTKNNRVIVQLSAYLYTGTIAKVTSLKASPGGITNRKPTLSLSPKPAVE